VLVWLCRKTGSYGENGPTLTMTTAVLFLVLTSAWITDRIGIHAIFGGFVAGLVIPYEIRAPLTEKIEDLVASLFLPIYFVLSGLKTNLGLLSDGSIWGWTMCVIFVAFFSKFLSSGAMGKINGLNWRESGAVGSLMACKGLVEVSFWR
jgi:Kef-type K+ transport system membrane component KefB